MLEVPPGGCVAGGQQARREADVLSEMRKTGTAGSWAVTSVSKLLQNTSIHMEYKDMRELLKSSKNLQF